MERSEGNVEAIVKDFFTLRVLQSKGISRVESVYLERLKVIRNSPDPPVRIVGESD